MFELDSLVVVWGPYKVVKWDVVLLIDKVIQLDKDKERWGPYSNDIG